jgi:hypothetical protein
MTQIDNDTNEQQYEQQYGYQQQYGQQQYQGQGYPQDQYGQQYNPQYGQPPYQQQYQPQYRQQDARDTGNISAEELEDFISKYESMEKQYKNMEKLIGKRYENLTDEDKKFLHETYGSKGSQSLPDDYRITDVNIINNLSYRVAEPEIQEQYLSDLTNAAKAFGISEDKVGGLDQYTWGVADGIYEGLSQQAAAYDEELIYRTDEAYGGTQVANEERMKAVSGIHILTELANNKMDLGYDLTPEDVFEKFLEAHGIAEHPLMIMMLSELDRVYNSRSYSRVYSGAIPGHGADSYGRTHEETQSILANKNHPDYMKVLQERVNERMRYGSR